MYSCGSPRMAEQKQDDQLGHTYSNYVRIWDVALKTGQKCWTIGKSGERGSGISVLVARHDDDDDCMYIYIYIHTHTCMIIIWQYMDISIFTKWKYRSNEYIVWCVVEINMKFSLYVWLLWFIFTNNLSTLTRNEIMLQNQHFLHKIHDFSCC